MRGGRQQAKPDVGRPLDGRVRPHSQRSSLRTTSLRPDQTSLTAHTLTSTNPSGNASSRIVSSATVVGTFAEDTIRELAFPLGFVDVKVCAVSEVWSGLKLVVRKELR